MAQAASQPRSQSIPRRTVVVVERPGSSASLRLRQAAAEAGFRVIPASSGPMLRSFARRNAPDLIVLTPDTGPPGPSEIARGIKEDPSTREIPVCQLVRAHARFFDDEASRAYPTEATLSEDAGDEEIVRTLRMLTARAPRVRCEQRDRAPLEGDLEGDAFPEVLQYLFAAGKTGCIRVNEGTKRRSSGRSGIICLESGRVVHAELGDLSGLAAFRKMCFSQRGWFEFDPGMPAPRKTMRGDGIGLLLEAARLKDVADRESRTPATKRAPRAARRDPFAVVMSEQDRGKPLLGIAVLVAVLVLAAYGLYA